ncbi:histone-like nucleoid-structuring protein Lsr2 [Klenkia marina]|uniref:histone-like nucleoid-structuring protein Lsr2 n=1 Tax=Klenkia marina TaxID=1960309 RepID=UPI000B87B0AB|nr:Lsr2 family protein [Klenkia marina]
MARKMQIMLEDDLTGEALEDGAGDTVTFALDGTSYEIDLSDDNAAEMREALSRYTAAARKVTTSGRRQAGSGGAPKRASGGGRTDLAAIREWAKANGHEVSERGRIAGAVVEAYDAAH